MNQPKIVLLFMVVCLLLGTAVNAQSDCLQDCLESKMIIKANNRLADALDDYQSNPSSHNAFRVDFNQLNVNLRNLECQWRCGEIEWNEDTCANIYWGLYYRMVKKWEFTRYYDSMLALLNHFMNTVFGCNVDSPG